MTIEEHSRWIDRSTGLAVFFLILFSGVSVVLHGRFDIDGVFLLAGILVVILTIIYYRSRQKPLDHLPVIIAIAVLAAIVGIVAFTVAANAIIHTGRTGPERISSGSGIAGPWPAPDAGLLGRQLNDTPALLTLSSAAVLGAGLSGG